MTEFLYYLDSMLQSLGGRYIIHVYMPEEDIVKVKGFCLGLVSNTKMLVLLWLVGGNKERVDDRMRSSA